MRLLMFAAAAVLVAAPLMASAQTLPQCSPRQGHAGDAEYRVSAGGDPYDPGTWTYSITWSRPLRKGDGYSLDLSVWDNVDANLTTTFERASVIPNLDPDNPRYRDLIPEPDEEIWPVWQARGATWEGGLEIPSHPETNSGPFVTVSDAFAAGEVATVTMTMRNGTVLLSDSAQLTPELFAEPRRRILEAIVALREDGRRGTCTIIRPPDPPLF